MRSHIRRVTAALLLIVLFGCRQQEDPATSPLPLQSCQTAEQYQQATAPAGFAGENAAIVPMGRRVSPVGLLVQVPYFPIAAAFSPDGSRAYVVHSGSFTLEVVDTVAGKVLQSIPDAGGFRGLAVGKDGAVFTAQATGGTVTRLDPSTDGSLAVTVKVELPGTPTSIALSPSGDSLFVVSSSNSLGWELDSDTFAIVGGFMTRGVYPYGLAVAPDGDRLLVTHTGDDTVTLIDRESGEVLDELPAGLNPMGIAVDGPHNRCYVVNSDGDSLSVYSLDPFEALPTVDLSGTPDQLPGGSPNELALSPAGDLLYISFSDLNMVQIFETEGFSRVGAIPTGHYPTGLAVSGDGLKLAICNSKGWGGAAKLKKEPSILSLVDIPVPEPQLSEWTATADANVGRTREFWSSTCPDPLPLPLDPSEEQVVQHVVKIVRENKTYDAVFGDFERGNGDPALLVFGEQYTPNLHEIARRYVNLDNYYADAQESFQGHTWTTQADCNDFFEKLYPSDLAQIVLGGYDPSAVLAERSVFDNFFEHGVTFRNYGEFESFTKDMFDLYADFIDFKYPYFNMAIPDVWKAEEFIRELNLGIFPEFVYIALPNDHTAGAKVGFPTPASMVADNDEATGMIVDALSHSEHWEETVVFIIEDDPQGYGGDHVHSHRSICVGAGPWLRSELTSSVHYSIPALYRTINMLLRVPPMHKNEAFAPPMYDIFRSGKEGDGPDVTPFEHLPRLVPEEYNQKGARMSAESELLDLSEPDAAPGMGYILWRVMRGDDEPPPYAKWNDR
ncbi:MAG: bifunctional YncE family protein/alkaline phosphatase family protein [Deltaproteobacteria bacterium]|nr:bifunctional YncE family protein/alkaline phosphatase family protein [Deltaproteobacteria bacterium]